MKLKFCARDEGEQAVRCATVSHLSHKSNNCYPFNRCQVLWGGQSDRDRDGDHWNMVPGVQDSLYEEEDSRVYNAFLREWPLLLWKTMAGRWVTQKTVHWDGSFVSCTLQKKQSWKTGRFSPGKFQRCEWVRKIRRDSCASTLNHWFSACGSRTTLSQGLSKITGKHRSLQFNS